MLELRHIAKRFESPVFGALDASFEKGKVHLLTGGNASGKTTLLKILAGRLLPDSGEISLDGKALSFLKYPFNLFSLSAVGEKFYEQISVFENLRFQLALRDAEAREEDILRQAERLGLSAKELREEPAGLSLGTRNKVSLLGALLSKSAYLLLDEAFAVLDAPSGERLGKALREEASAGRTVIFSSQTGSGLGDYADAFHFLKDGVLTREAKR